MPCRVDILSEEDIRRIEEEQHKYETDPVYRAIIDEQKIKEKEKLESWKKEQTEKKQKESDDELKNGTLDNMAFNSFMAVFLCKAMKIIESNNLMQYTYHDMEWWWKEHKKRDKNLPGASKEELTEKLIFFRDHFTVAK